MIAGTPLAFTDPVIPSSNFSNRERGHRHWSFLLTRHRTRNRTRNRTRQAARRRVKVPCGGAQDRFDQSGLQRQLIRFSAVHAITLYRMIKETEKR